MPAIVVNAVIFEKAAISAEAELRTDQVVFYNYVAGMVLEAILQTADEWPGGRRDVVASFGHVRGFPHHETLARGSKGRAWATDSRFWRCRERWRRIRGGRWRGSEKNEAFDGPERHNRTEPEGSGSRPGVLSAAIEGLVELSLAVASRSPAAVSARASSGLRWFGCGVRCGG
ncbi:MULTISPECIES: hypothetical protein [Kribbella]|uniref:hypothetical protein n=1 Tax=Kribbella TaxID=182639 RepID=UPI00104484D6|nr:MULTISPECIES: hypothetical protein [Kribbella]